MLLITFVELRVVAGRSRTRAGSPTGRLSAGVLCRGLEMNCMVGAWHGHGHGMVSVNQTRPHCVNHMGKTQYGHGTAGEWHHRSGLLHVNRPYQFLIYDSYFNLRHLYWADSVISDYGSVSEPPGRGPVPGPGIDYTGPREVLLEFVILVF